MDFGMPTLIENGSLEENISLCKELGLQFVELNMNFPMYQLAQLEQTDRLKKLANENKIYFTIHLDENLNICDFNPLVADGYLDFETEAIEELLQSSLFALTWDIGHSHTCDNVDEAFLMKHRDRLYHFHIHDGLGNKNHQTLGTGEIDLEQRLGIAGACGCRCVVETKTIEALRRSVEWLKINGYKK